MGFKSDLGVFSPEGRLIQVEFAQFASNQGSTAVIHALGNSITIAYENRQIDPLVIPTPKIHVVDSFRNIYIMYSGFKPDSLLITEQANSIIRNHKYSTSQDISLVSLAHKIAEFQQKFTVDHRMRPLGLRSVLMGIENGKGRIFIIETDGNVSEYQKIAVGFKNEVCNSFLENSEEEFTAFYALKEVVQNDYKKIKGFVINEEKLIEVDEDVLKNVMGN